MFSYGPMPGATPKQDALNVLPEGTICQRVSSMGITGYVVTLPNGQSIASAGNANQAWEKAERWGHRNSAKPMG